jgi:hypothetical protein
MPVAGVNGRVRGTAKLVERLNAAAIEAATAPGYYFDGAGLHMQVSKDCGRSWILRHAFKGRARETGLGSLSAFSLAEARKRAREKRQLLADGIDPLETKRAQQIQETAEQATRVTFKQAAESFIDDQWVAWKDESYRQWRNILATYAYPVIGDVPVQDVDTAMVVNILEPIWTTKTETADRVRSRIQRVLDNATTLDQRVGPNPARWNGHLQNVLPPPSKVVPVKHRPGSTHRGVV